MIVVDYKSTKQKLSKKILILKPKLTVSGCGSDREWGVPAPARGRQQPHPHLHPRGQLYCLPIKVGSRGIFTSSHYLLFCRYLELAAVFIPSFLVLAIILSYQTKLQNLIISSFILFVYSSHLLVGLFGYTLVNKLTLDQNSLD